MAKWLSLANAGRNTLKGLYPDEVQRDIMSKLIGACSDVNCPGTVPFENLLSIKAVDRLRPGQRRDTVSRELRALIPQGKARWRDNNVGLTVKEAYVLYDTVLGCTDEEDGALKCGSSGRRNR